MLAGLLPLISFANQSSIPVEIKNKRAKKIFENLTNVQEEGAAGHSYKKGKSILCWRVNADIDDGQGRPIPLNDVRRYKCRLNVDASGLATADNRF